MVSLIQNKNEPTTVLCRRGEVLRWTGWERRYLAKLVANNVLKVSTPFHDTKRFYYTAQIRALLEK